MNLKLLIGLRVTGKYSWNIHEPVTIYQGTIQATEYNILTDRIILNICREEQESIFTSSWCCTQIVDTDHPFDSFTFAADGENGELIIYGLTNDLKKQILSKPKRPRWALLTGENAHVGATVSNRKARREYRRTLTITHIGPICIETLPNNSYYKVSLYTNVMGVYLYNYRSAVWIDLNTIPKPRKFRCIQCHKPGAKFKKGLCKACNLIPF